MNEKKICLNCKFTDILNSSSTVQFYCYTHNKVVNKSDSCTKHEFDNEFLNGSKSRRGTEAN